MFVKQEKLFSNTVPGRRCLLIIAVNSNGLSYN